MAQFRLKRTVAKGTRGSSTTMVQRSRRISPTEKATYHNITGAGRSRVIREFFGLSSDDEAAIVTRLSRFIEDAIA